MRLKKLDIYGFKSFADRTQITFDQGITGIVGPNGSGKSNISDAVRWVLGEQSAKSLRGGKMEDVIFNGTQKRKKLGYCEVTLTFDNEDRALNIDYTEVAVTRRLYRSGESEYKLNGSACRLKDIVDLFRDTGIGKEGYSLIGQGRIDEILSAKSEDRRQVFEEAAGIVKYKARKNEAERRMSNTTQNLTRVEDILEELNSQLEPLAKQSEQARRYITLREELKTLELNAFIIRSDRTKERIDDLEKNLAGLAEAIEQGEKRIEQSSTERTEQEEAVAQTDREVSAAHAQVLDFTRDQEVREGENNVLRAGIEHARKDEERMREEHDMSESRLERLMGLTAESTDDEMSRAEALGSDLAALREKEAALEQAQAHAQAAEEALDVHKAAIIDAMNRLSDARTTQTRLSTMRQTLEKRLEESTDEQSGMEEELNILTHALSEAEQNGAQTSMGLDRLQKEAQRLDAVVRDANARAENIKGQVQQLSGNQQALSSRLRVLREMERDFQGYQGAVKQVLLHAGKDGGVHGVVANLLRVPKDYERAIEAVLGGALQNVVTKDEYVAKDMIAYLRNNRFGRATFLPITSVRGRTLSRDERQVLALDGCLGVASELITFDEQHRGIMESLLGRTIVARDLDAGINIMRRGRQSFRLVTLGGDVMHSGGSMTGGSAQSRMTSLLSREREIKEHEAQIAENTKKIAAFNEQLSQCEAQRSEAKRLRGEMYDQLHQEQIAVARDQERTARASSELSAHKERMQQAEMLREQIADNLSDIGVQLDEMTSTHDDEQHNTEQMNALTSKLAQAQTSARNEVDGLRDEVTAFRVRLAAQERELEALKRDGARLEQEKQSLARRIQESEQAITALARGRQQDEEALEAALIRQADGLEKLKSAQIALNEAEKRREQKQELVRTLTQQLDALRNVNAQDVDKHHRFELQLSRAQGELQQMQERIWEEYELTYAGAEEFKQPEFELALSEKRIASIRGEIRQMGAVNVNAIEDYRICRERHDDLCAQRDDLVNAQQDLEGIIQGLLVKMEKQFRENFELLTMYFSETFVRLFGGGRAELKLMDPSDALNCGIEIVAQPPGKKLQMLSLLSGGERALTAVAILFAMLRLKPTPFCILDEIEAALDDANVGYYADFLREFTQTTQFVVVTHRKGTMERCDSLYGVAMEEKGVSKMISVQLKDWEE